MVLVEWGFLLERGGKFRKAIFWVPWVLFHPQIHGQLNCLQMSLSTESFHFFYPEVLFGITWDGPVYVCAPGISTNVPFTLPACITNCRVSWVQDWRVLELGISDAKSWKLLDSLMTVAIKFVVTIIARPCDGSRGADHAQLPPPWALLSPLWPLSSISGLPPILNSGFYYTCPYQKSPTFL